MATGLRVVVDMGFLEQQNLRVSWITSLDLEIICGQEQNSVIKQVACAYGIMKKSELQSLLSLHFSSYRGKIAEICNKRGMDVWKVRIRVRKALVFGFIMNTSR